MVDLGRWLGEEYYDHFDPRNRDTMHASLYENDRAAFHSEKVPYAKNNLQYVSSCLDYHTSHGAHDALNDCIRTAETYRRMLQRGGLL